MISKFINGRGLCRLSGVIQGFKGNDMLPTAVRHYELNCCFSFLLFEDSSCISKYYSHSTKCSDGFPSKMVHLFAAAVHLTWTRLNIERRQSAWFFFFLKRPVTVSNFEKWLKSLWNSNNFYMKVKTSIQCYLLH